MLHASLTRFARQTLKLLRSQQHPLVLQYPSASLLQSTANTTFSDEKAKKAVIERMLDTRAHYEFPGLSAVQIGVNVAAFVVSFPDGGENFEVRSSVEKLQKLSGMQLPDKTILEKVRKVRGLPVSDLFVCENPKILWQSERRCWAWEACASCCYLMHYIERPSNIIATWKSPVGDTVLALLTGMASRLFQHEMDHIDGKAFYERIPDQRHAVPLSGFRTMSSWEDDYPSIEARSTNIYSIFTPPYTFRSEVPLKSAFIDRIMDEEVYPGVDFDIEMTSQLADNDGTRPVKLQ